MPLNPTNQPTCGPLHMDEQRQDDRCRYGYSPEDLPEAIEKGGEKGSGISVLMARNHNDDEFNRVSPDLHHSFPIISLRKIAIQITIIFCCLF